VGADLSPVKKKGVNGNSLQDILFLIGIIVFTSVLIIGLFPGRSEAGLIDEDFFITAAMTVPVIAGIYFIVISFRRSLNIESIDIRESISKKITLAFVFIALLSTMPIVIISSTYFNQTLSRLFRGSTIEALRESIRQVDDNYDILVNEVRLELENLELVLQTTGRIQHDIVFSKSSELLQRRGFQFSVYNRSNSGEPFYVNRVFSDFSGIHDYLRPFYKSKRIDNIRLDRVSFRGMDFISGAFNYHSNIVVINKIIPESLIKRERLFLQAYREYKEVHNLKEYFVSGSGSFLMLLSILIMVIAYVISLYLSGTITRPVLNLSGAAKELAKGNYKVSIERSTNDELGELVDAFNRMVRQLDENNKIMLQKQRLEAWNEMARRLVHEIKNPLTPIRLSAERMRKLVKDNNIKKDEAVITGSETIINEVNSLLRLVSEFNDFARLPEKRAEMGSLNALIKETVSLFGVYENVAFEENYDPAVPDILIDKVLIRQAFNNLLANAVHAMEESGKITLSTEYDKNNSRIIVRLADNGPGIDSDLIDKIFVPGFSQKSSGSGLGLAIVEKIVLEHFGTITCNSVKGKGTEFVIGFQVMTGVE
jgi:nitrogen fixation/metabolism regulation signal transduction histidine kinase